MTLHSRASKIIDDFNFFNSWEEKYEHIIDLGKSLPELNESLKTDAALIRGCQSKVWMHCEYKNKKLYFYADSDALIAKGLVALIINLYSGLSAEDVLDENVDFLKQIGLQEHLSMTRSNGLNMMLEKIRNYGKKYQKNG
tara:strand:+ start:421 stop:840 length:420 start_codon:yes stop_codon:yes gene_type:complete